MATTTTSACTNLQAAPEAPITNPEDVAQPAALPVEPADAQEGGAPSSDSEEDAGLTQGGGRQQPGLVDYSLSPQALGAILGHNIRVPVEKLKFDLAMCKGQIRPLSRDLLEKRVQSLEACPPVDTVADILLLSDDLAGMPQD